MLDVVLGDLLHADRVQIGRCRRSVVPGDRVEREHSEDEGADHAERDDEALAVGGSHHYLLRG